MKCKLHSTKIFILFLLTINFSCDTPKSKVPQVYVNFEININHLEYRDLKVIGNSIYVTGGVKGIIIFRKSTDEFISYERACPHDPECGRVFVDKSGYNAKDTLCCNSEFSLLISGGANSGPAEFPLKMYSTEYNSYSGVLRVTN